MGNKIGMYDLIYGGKEVEIAFRNQYPNAKIEDASDDIHHERFTFVVKDEDYDEREYFKFLLLSGSWRFSFHFQVLFYGNGRSKIIDIARELEDTGRFPDDGGY